MKIYKKIQLFKKKRIKKQVYNREYISLLDKNKINPPNLLSFLKTPIV